MFQLDRELYDVPDEEKMAYDVDKLSELKLNGYVNKSDYDLEVVD